MSSCNVTQSVPQNEHLLVKNTIQFPKKLKKKNINKENLQLLVAQQPNKKLFGVLNLRLGIYNLVYNKKENKFKWWLKNKLGEAPVLYQDKFAEISSNNLQRFLYNKGYLNAEVSFKTVYENKKVKVDYTIIPNEAYKINNIKIPPPDNTLLLHINEVQASSLLIKDEQFDIDVLDNERKRITQHLRNMGYFQFRKDYIVFELDSNQQNHTIDIQLTVKKAVNNQDHLKYTINDIFVIPNDINFNASDSTNDTVIYNQIYFVNIQEQYRPTLLSNGIFFENEKYFRLDSYENTMKKLANFGSFKFVDIQFEEFTKNNKPYLDVYVILTSAKKQNVSIDVEANHNFTGLTGASVGFTYQNRNLSKASDLLEFKVSSGVEFNIGNNLPPLNNADVIVETNYYLNKFLVPFPLKNISKYNNVKTKISLQYNFERRIGNYSLHSNTFNFGYEWKEAANKKHIYNPISANLLILPEKNLTQSFLDRINEIPSLRRSFEEQLILGSNYSFLYNNQKSENDRSFFFFQGKVAFAGNLIHGIVALTKQAKNNPRPYSIFNREYSQFIRLESNFVHYFQFAKHASLHSRFNAGIIIPYGNSTTAPYFQQFYAGGSNSIRAFRLRALGPGTYADEENINNPNFFFDQAGDIKFELNTELRFDIYKWFKGALFLDGGNVWLLKEDPDREGGHFNKENFLNGIALGTGFGLRLDFDYFVIRTDFALPIIDPRFDGKDRYPLHDFKFSVGKNSWFREHSIFHLAIGYPF